MIIYIAPKKSLAHPIFVEPSAVGDDLKTVRRFATVRESAHDLVDLRKKNRPCLRVIAAEHGVAVNTVQRIAHAQ